MFAKGDLKQSQVSTPVQKVYTELFSAGGVVLATHQHTLSAKYMRKLNESYPKQYKKLVKQVESNNRAFHKAKP